MTAAPGRLAAQDGLAAQPNAALDAKSAKPEGSKNEQEEANKFRHTALVHSAAKVLHLSDETTARTFEYINFSIIALAIVIPLFKYLPKFLRTRGEKIQADIESARKVTEDANTRLSAIEAKLAGLGEEIAKFRSEVEQESFQDEARIKAALAEESARIVAAAEQEIDLAAAQARRGLRYFAADLAIEQAGKQLVLTPETDKALIAEFVADVARNGSTRGGNN
jgi:F-type H+-transporting ATPase subunit b